MSSRRLSNSWNASRRAGPAVSLSPAELRASWTLNGLQSQNIDGIFQQLLSTGAAYLLKDAFKEAEAPRCGSSRRRVVLC